MLRIISKNPSMIKGIPTGAALRLIINVIPTIINTTDKIPANNRPVILKTRVNKYHKAVKGHRNQNDFFLSDIVTSVQMVMCMLNIVKSSRSGISIQGFCADISRVEQTETCPSMRNGKMPAKDSGLQPCFQAVLPKAAVGIRALPV